MRRIIERWRTVKRIGEGIEEMCKDIRESGHEPTLGLVAMPFAYRELVRNGTTVETRYVKQYLCTKYPCLAKHFAEDPSAAEGLREEIRRYMEEEA